MKTTRPNIQASPKGHPAPTRRLAPDRLAPPSYATAADDDSDEADARRLYFAALIEFLSALSRPGEAVSKA